MTRSILIFAAAVLGAAAPAVSAAQVTPGGQPGRILSPRDTVRFEVAPGQRIYVDYGRPFMRGRRIMGGLVPYGRVWRTGANAATTLVTDVDLVIGDHPVPRGTYTLYTLPTARGWTLIVNRQTGQWGTQYEPARDLVRIPMQVSALREPVQQFTIKLERGRGGEHVLALEWENTRATVPFRTAAPAVRHSGAGSRP
ncbi:MAG TPA: DUF2911 domain-containing protein [Longimicrobiaceae bacterium]